MVQLAFGESVEDLQKALESQTGICSSLPRLFYGFEELRPGMLIDDVATAAIQRDRETTRDKYLSDSCEGTRFNEVMDVLLIRRSSQEAFWIEELKKRWWSHDWLQDAPEAARENR